MLSPDTYRKMTSDLSGVRSWEDYENHRGFQEYQPTLSKILGVPEIFHATPKIQDSKKIFRITSWNIERGMALDPIISTFNSHPSISKSDIVILTEVDCGMARSGNHHVAQELSRGTNLHAVYVPCYFNLDQGNGAERTASRGENSVGLQGNAILSRYPIKNARSIPLPNTKDHLGGQERQIGQEYAIVATVITPSGSFDVVCAHLAAHSSRDQRVEQALQIAKTFTQNSSPAIIGGDFNTSTYNSNKAWRAILSFWRRVFMGNAITHHYPYPENYFEKKLFQTFRDVGFSEEGYNVKGGCTLHYDFNEPFFRMSLEDWLPKWCFHFIDWALKPHDGKCSFKLDWFLGRGLKPVYTEIVQDLPRGENRYSDHDPIIVDVMI